MYCVEKHKCQKSHRSRTCTTLLLGKDQLVVEFRNLLYAEATPSSDQVQLMLERAA